MQLIQIGQTQPAPVTRTVLEMFMELAEREAELTRAARERAISNTQNTTGQ